MLVLTGLRRGELASLTVGQLDLEGPMPVLVLKAGDEKNRDGSMLPIRRDLADDLALWIKDLTQRNTGDPGASEGRSCLPLPGVPLDGKLPGDTPLFDVPRGLVRALDKDLAMAGIAKCDDRGRTVDVHALRHSFGTLLSKGGVAPRTAQAAMRHSTIDLTMNTYTDPRLPDVQGALDALPALPLNGPGADLQKQRATGTDGRFAPAFAPTPDDRCKPVSIRGNPAGFEGADTSESETQETPCFPGVFEAEGTGFEPATGFPAPHFQCGR